MSSPSLPRGVHGPAHGLPIATPPFAPVFGGMAAGAKAPARAWAGDSHRPLAGTKGQAQAAVPLAPGAVDDAAVSQEISRLAAVARREAAEINKSAQAVSSGHVVARGFNHVVNVFTHHEDHMEASRQAAVRSLTSTLPAELETFHRMITAAGTDPVKRQQATAFLDGALSRVNKATDGFATHQAELSKSNKFWSGIAADTIAGVGVVAGLALTATGVGAPVGIALVAGSFAAGGALSIGAHAALDNQFDIRKEGLATFVIGGISGAATALTAGASAAVSGRLTAGAAKVFGAEVAKGAVVKGAAMAISRGLTYAATGASVSGVQAIVQESQDGYKPGAGGRIAKAVGVGAVGGFVGGALWSGVSSLASAAGGSVLQRLSPTLSGQITALGTRIDGSRVGRALLNTATGAFYGGPVGAAGTWIAAKMTGQSMTASEFWHQTVGGAIQGGAVYGAWASTKVGGRDLEASGSNAIEAAARRAPSFRKLQAASSHLLAKTKFEATRTTDAHTPAGVRSLSPVRIRQSTSEP